jgi:hypothetical protein
MIFFFFYKYFKNSNKDITNILIKNKIAGENLELLENIYTLIYLKINLKIIKKIYFKI